MHGKCLSLPRPSAVPETKHSSPGCRLVGELRECREHSESACLQGCERQPVLSGWGWGWGRRETLEEEAWAGDRETSPSLLPTGPRKRSQRPGGHTDFPSQEGLLGPISVPRGGGAACPVSSTKWGGGGGAGDGAQALPGCWKARPRPPGSFWSWISFREKMEAAGGEDRERAGRSRPCTANLRPTPESMELGAPPGWGTPSVRTVPFRQSLRPTVWPFAHK